MRKGTHKRVKSKNTVKGVIPQMLVEDIAQGDCVLFIGAGLSMAAGLPGWKTLVKPLCKHLGVSENSDPLSVTQVFERTEGRQRLESYINKRVQTSGINPTDLHLHLRLADLGLNTWITTNYDNLIEETLKKVVKNKDVVPVVKDIDLTRITQNAVVLIKLHGDKAQPDTLTLTKNDYFVYPQRFPLIWQKVADILIAKTVLFIGYSLQDPDFNQLQAQITYYLRKHARRSYAVLKDADKFDYNDLASRNIDVINLSEWGGKDIAECLCRFLEDLKKQVDSCMSRSIPRTEYPIEKAKDIIPPNIFKEMRRKRLSLIKCIEYLVYCDLIDKAQQDWPPQGWKPSELQKALYRSQVIKSYRRIDAQGNIYLGVTIWQKKNMK